VTTMNDAHAQECQDAAAHWDRLAVEARAQAAWDREHGLDLSSPGMSAGDYRAETYERCARTLRAEAATGEPHCMCHERPKSRCTFGGMGVRT